MEYDVVAFSVRPFFPLIRNKRYVGVLLVSRVILEDVEEVGPILFLCSSGADGGDHEAIEQVGIVSDLSFGVQISGCAGEGQRNCEVEG